MGDVGGQVTATLRPLRVLLTAGGTREPIDDVRHIRNVATGSLPAAMAECLLARGAEVHYLHGPDTLLPGRVRAEFDVTSPDTEPHLQLAELKELVNGLRVRLAPGRLTLHPIGTAAEAAATLAALCRDLQPDLVACAMAVADFSPEAAPGKLGSRQPDGHLTLRLRPTAKAIDSVRAAAPDCALLGFKLLSGASDDELRNAAAHLAKRAGCDWVFGNDMADYRAGRRRGVLFARDGSVLARPGGDGEGGLQALAESLTATLLTQLGAR